MRHLPLLDILITHQLYGSLSHQVYQKKTNIDIYTHSQTHHHRTKKYVVPKTIISQAIWNFYPQNVNIEKTHLTKSFLAIDFSLTHVNKVFYSSLYARPKKSPFSNPPLALISLPYNHGVSNEISKFLAKKILKLH